MRSKRKLKPGDPGTQKFLRRYGEDLVCVRYRYDATAGRRVTTVELIVEAGPWQKRPDRIPQNKTVRIRVDHAETQLRKLVKNAGGKWNAEERLWELQYGEVKQLGLTKRMVKDE
ncbi:MAG: hypothetical protein ACE5IY_22700 [bacterium]